MPDGEGASVSIICCRSLSRGAQDKHVEHVERVERSTGRSNATACSAQRHIFSWLNKGDPVQVRTEQAAGCLQTSWCLLASDEHFFQKASPLLRCRRLSISGRFCKTTSCMAFGAVTLPLRRQSWQHMCTAYMFGSQFVYAVGWLTIPHRNSCSSFNTTCCSTFVNA